MADFERFRAVVLEDASLQEQLFAETEVESFIARLIDLATQRGFAVSEEEVRSALLAANRSWIERQVR